MFNFTRSANDSNTPIMAQEIKNGSQISSEDDDEIYLESNTMRRRYKTYTVMQRSGFQHTEYIQVMLHLCKAEIFISTCFLVHGMTCPGFEKEAAYQGTCHMNIVAALVGIFTGGMGLGAVHRFRWKTMLIMWLLMCIISAVGNLLAVITTGVWLDHLSKMKERTGIVNGLSGMMLLGSVLVGVCFILTAVIICHYWVSNSTKYQAVGRVAKRAKSLRRRSSRPNSGSERRSRADRFHKNYQIV
uniref:MFS domain-containing protein n=1 Tax=Parastrongyloides trichosuri TaxID=131310 RepID=A0A0N4ZBU5_PARTI